VCGHFSSVCSRARANKCNGDLEYNVRNLCSRARANKCNLFQIFALVRVYIIGDEVEIACIEIARIEIAVHVSIYVYS